MIIEKPKWVNQVTSSSYDLNELPNNIENEIMEYLLLEYGNKNNEYILTYVGKFNLWGKPIKCWEFGNSEVYVTIQPYRDSYYIGVTNKIVSNEKNS